MNYVGNTAVTLGCDPEFFFMRDGKVVPSTELIKKVRGASVIPDGFQGELNPQASFCREIAATKIAQALEEARDIAGINKCTLDFSVGHTIDDETWKRTPILTKRFGCNPTENINKEKHRLVTGLREKYRCAGGHIHLGLDYIVRNRKDTEKLIKVMDILVGNTFVMLDRDPDNARRRKFYGRAGEFRNKPYGVEYRTLSNFWLKSYTLYSIATGLVRNSASAVANGWADALLEKFDMNDIREAINNNDYDKAFANWKKVRAFYLKHNITSYAGLCSTNVRYFEKLLTCTDVLKEIDCDTEDKQRRSWQDRLYGGGTGMESFLEEKYDCPES